MGYHKHMVLDSSVPVEHHTTSCGVNCMNIMGQLYLLAQVRPSPV